MFREYKFYCFEYKPRGEPKPWHIKITAQKKMYHLMRINSKYIHEFVSNLFLHRHKLEH